MSATTPVRSCNYCFEDGTPVLGRNKTLGVVGYGDIGQACARMARVFGMHILALRRRTDLSESERESDLTVTSARSLPCSLLGSCNNAGVLILIKGDHVTGTPVSSQGIVLYTSFLTVFV